MKLPTPIRSIGPAIIVASIVLGPGSILTSSKVGCQYGYQVLWVLIGAAILMIGMTALAAYLGVLLQRTLCEELAHRLHRAAAATIGIIVFVMIACFQSSNNAAVLASVEGLIEGAAGATVDGQAGSFGTTAQIVALLVLNGLIIATLYGFRNLYRPLELLMMLLVMAMLVAFSLNLFAAQPSVAEIAGGLLPTITAPSTDVSPAVEGNAPPAKHVWALFGLVATTFSIAGAFYQGYLVREKGWTVDNVRNGLIDSVTGIALLGLVSCIVMITSAAALHGVVSYEQLDSAADIARQLEPMFGRWATLLFSFGIFAAAFSSFLGNALVGGTVLADGLGLGSSIDAPWTKRLTVLALLCGMAVAITTTAAGSNAVNVIMVAQALTVLGGPALAALLLWFGFTASRSNHAIPRWVLVLASCGGLVVLVLAAQTAYRLLESVG